MSNKLSLTHSFGTFLSENDIILLLFLLFLEQHDIINEEYNSDTSGGYCEGVLWVVGYMDGRKM